MELAASMNIASFGENGETPVQHSSLEHRRATRYISTCKTIHGIPRKRWHRSNVWCGTHNVFQQAGGALHMRCIVICLVSCLPGMIRGFHFSFLLLTLSTKSFRFWTIIKTITTCASMDDLPRVHKSQLAQRPSGHDTTWKSKKTGQSTCWPAGPALSRGLSWGNQDIKWCSELPKMCTSLIWIDYRKPRFSRCVHKIFIWASVDQWCKAYLKTLECPIEPCCVAWQRFT